MAEFVKDVIKPGIFHNGKELFSVTDEDIDRWIANFNEMQAAKLRVPVPFDHPDPKDEQGYPVDTADAKRLEIRERSRLNAGWVNQLYRDGDTLKARIEIPRDEDASKLREVGSFVSPQFGSWTDGKGRRWSDVVSHLAITPRPVNVDQSSEFVEVGKAKASDAKPISGLKEPVRFSLEDQVIELEVGDEQTQMSDGQQQFNQGNNQQSGQQLNQPNNQQQNQNQNQNGQNPNGQPQDNAGKLRGVLQQLGITIADGTEIGGDASALAELVAVLTRHMESKDREKKVADEQAQKQNGGKPNDVKVEPTMQLSAEVQKLIDEKVAAATADANAKVTQLSTANQHLAAETTKSKREKLNTRIDSLAKSGRCTPPQTEGWKKVADSYQFGAETDDVTKLNHELDFAEQLPEGTFWTDAQKVQQMSVSEERKNSQFWTGEEISDEDADKLVDQLIGKA